MWSTTVPCGSYWADMIRYDHDTVSIMSVLVPSSPAGASWGSMPGQRHAVLICWKWLGFFCFCFFLGVWKHTNIHDSFPSCIYCAATVHFTASHSFLNVMQHRQVNFNFAHTGCQCNKSSMKQNWETSPANQRWERINQYKGEFYHSVQKLDSLFQGLFKSLLREYPSKFLKHFIWST